MDSDHIKHNIHYGLLIRLLIYILLLAVILGFLISHIILDNITITLPSIALVLGFLIGIVFSRILKISWDKNGEKVISSLDMYGFYILIVYIIFEIFRDRIVEYFIHGPEVASTSLALFSGTMIGRLLGIRRKITTILDENV